jgi:hypothetical protein
MASWQVAHPALNTSIFRLAAIALMPSMLALPRLNGSRWQRDGRRYPLEVAPRSSVELHLRALLIGEMQGLGHFEHISQRFCRSLAASPESRQGRRGTHLSNID